MHKKEVVAMDTDLRQIDTFLIKCDELMQSKFIIADTKISEVLKSIAASDLLYAFFRDITGEFDYPAAQQKYMNYSPEGTQGMRKLLFPEDPQQKLAFIFCLLVDFDSKRIDLSRFLQEYFYGDGSVYESFYAFCNQVIKPFRNTVRQMFRGWKSSEQEEEMLALEKLRKIVQSERARIFSSNLSDVDKVNALIILNALNAVQDDRELINGLLCGYRCFAEKTRWKSPDAETLFKELDKGTESV